MRNKVMVAAFLMAFVVMLICKDVQAQPIGIQAEMVENSQEEALTKEQADRIVYYIIDQIASGALDSEDAVKKAIEEGEKEFQITLSESEKSSMIRVVNTINSWELDTEGLTEKVKELYEKYGIELLENPEKAIAGVTKDVVEEGTENFLEGVGNFFISMGAGVKSFFQNAAKSFFELF